MKILVADDSKVNLILVSITLKKLGHEVITATTGHEAIEMYQQEHPDLIILDVVMEDLDGYECARRIRAADPENWIPIIFLSLNVDDESIAKGIDAGGDDYITKPFSEITLAAKVKAMQRIADMRKQLCYTTQELSRQAATDALTGIYNRAQFDKTIKEKLAFAKRHDEFVALLFLDLDNFKNINDSLGHQAGDLLLQEIAARLNYCLRLEDFIARLGGDEFAIILSGVNTPDAAAAVADKVIKSLSKPYLIADNLISITCSIGIACYPIHDSPTETLVQQADMAMYHAKELGRNNYQFFNEALNEEYKKKISLENALKDAVSNEKLFLVYQPIFNLHTKQLVRIEALCCFTHPQLGVIPAHIFIPLAEEIGLIDRIGEWALLTATKQAAFWYAQGHKDFKIAVNLSPRQLLHRTLPQMISRVLAKTGLPPHILELELTETSAITHLDSSEEIIKEINAMGIGVSLDDFGTGFSSFTHVKRLPINAIKIDMSFVQDATASGSDSSIIMTLINLGKALNIDVIAEGIETASQLQFLIDNGCQLGQGYYLSKPLTQDAMTQLLERKENIT